MRISGFIVFVACVVAWAFAVPVSDSEAAYRILNQYLQRFGAEDLRDTYFIGDHGCLVAATADSTSQSAHEVGHHETLVSRLYELLKDGFSIPLDVKVSSYKKLSRFPKKEDIVVDPTNVGLDRGHFDLAEVMPIKGFSRY